MREPARRCNCWPRRSVALLLFLVAAASGAWAKEFAIATKHYEVTTDVSPEFTTLVGEHMEQILAEYRRRLSGFECDLNERFRVVVYKERADYDANVPKSLAGSTGAFMSGSKTLATYLGERTREEAFRTLYHEGFHQFMFRCIARKCPLWVNEGLAEYFAEATWNGRGFETGQVPPERLTVVQKGIRTKEFLPFKRLFAMKTDAWLSHLRIDRSRASLQYSQAWSIVHFLIHGDHGRHRQKLLGYLQDIARGMNEETAFERNFGANLAGFEKGWQRYVMNLKPSPKYRCKRNIRLLMFVALRIYGTPEKFRSLSDLRRALLYDEHLEWSLTSGFGEQFSSANRQQAATLFLCPFDRSRGKISYMMLTNPRTGRPMLFCTHHPGIVMKGYYKRSGDGNYKVVVEEQVIATLPPDLLRALRAKLR